MRKVFVALLLLSLPACEAAEQSATSPSSGSASMSGWHQDLCTLDAGIDKLTNLRDLELSRAARFQDQGDRLQFRNNDLMDARRYWQQAQNSRDIAARYQQEIDKLELQREKLLTEHGISDMNYGRDNPNCKAQSLKLPQ